MHWKLSSTRGVSTLGVEASSGSVLKAVHVYFILWFVYGVWGIKHIHADTCYMHHTPPSCSTRVPPPQYADGAPAQGILAISFGPRVGHMAKFTESTQLVWYSKRPHAAPIPPNHHPHRHPHTQTDIRTLYKSWISNFKLSQNGREVKFFLLSTRAPRRLQKPLFEFSNCVFWKVCDLVSPESMLR